MSKSEPLHGDKVRAVGVARMQDNDRAVLVCFDRKPTDDELRDVHDTLAGRIVAPSAGVQTFAVDVPTLDEALVVLGEMYEVADTEGMDDETVIPVWPADVAYDFAPLKVKHIRALMRSFNATQSAREASVTIPLETARLVRKACLPANPNKCRGWHPDLLAAVRAYIAAVDAAVGPTATK
jgi:hypothetical protein